MNKFNLTSKFLALFASAVLVSGQQCTLPFNVAIFVAIPGFESIEPLYCFSDVTTQDILDAALGLALEKESTSPGFISTCGFQILPNIANDLALTSYPECPPPGEPSPLTFLTTAIEPTFVLSGGGLYSITYSIGDEDDGVYGVWCVNFDICNRDDFIDYMIPATTLFNQDLIGDEYITSFQTFTQSCLYTGLYNLSVPPLTCSDETIFDCDDKLLLDVTIGSDEPFSMVACNDECNAAASSPDVLDILSYFYTTRSLFCLPEDTSISVEYSSRAFQLDEYCEAEEIKARDGNCVNAKSTKEAKAKAKSSKGPKDSKSGKSSKGPKDSKSGKSSKGPKAKDAKSSKMPKEEKATKVDKSSKAPKSLN